MCLRQRYIRQCSLVRVYTVSPPPVCQQEVLGMEMGARKRGLRCYRILTGWK
uniref:Uncharacterized protein n=1 Tax=Klebsiella pneumoniae TaxID=573 RepID=A0A8B0SW25_KLEPN|nr:hypothetical protein [Klebsiella pneumoniae]